MNKEIPSASKLVAFNDFKRNWQIHQQKIKNIKSSVQSNNNKPKMQSTRKNIISIQNHNRMLEISLENKALLKKLTQRQKQQKTCDQTHRLIKNNRKQYYQQYTRKLQNQGLLKRIRDTKTSYKMTKYVQQRKGTQKYINLISKFQYKDLKPTKTLLNFQVDNDQSKYKGCFDQYSNNYNKENQQPSLANSRSCQNNMQNKNDYNRECSVFKNPLRNSGESNGNKKRSVYKNKTSNSYKQQQIDNKQFKCDKIIQIVPVRRKTSDDKTIDIKAIQFQQRVVIQIGVQGQQECHCLEISRSMFQQKFKGRIRKMLNCVAYNDKKDYFYIS